MSLPRWCARQCVRFEDELTVRDEATTNSEGSCVYMGHQGTSL